MQVKGRVSEVKVFQGKYGPMHSLIIDGEAYGTGKTSMGVSEGEYVSFTATTNARGYKDVDKGSLKAVEAPPAYVPGLAASRPTAHVDVRQESIIFQSSRKDALEFLNILVLQGAIDFGKAKGAEKQAILEMYLDKYTEHFIEEVKANKPHPSQGDTSTKAKAKPAQSSDNDPEDEIPF